MYQAFTIKDFRCFESLELSNLKRINLITGGNNVGKTALLEAIFLHSGSYNPELLLVVTSMRGHSGIKYDFATDDGSFPLDSLFRGFDGSKVVRLHGTWSQRAWSVNLSRVQDHAELSGLSIAVRRTLEKSQGISDRLPALVYKLEYRRDRGQPQRYFLILDGSGKHVEPTPPIASHSTKLHKARSGVDTKGDAALFSRVLSQGREEAFVRALAVLEPRLKSIHIALDDGNEPMLHGDIGLEQRHVVPLGLMGDGLQRLASTLLLIATTRNGVLLIDEIEIGWHHSVLEDIWRTIVKFATEYNVQVFCTTHSLECLVAAYSAMRDTDNLSVCRLERTGGSVRALQYDSEALTGAVNASLEIR